MESSRRLWSEQVLLDSSCLHETPSRRGENGRSREVSSFIWHRILTSSSLSIWYSVPQTQIPGEATKQLKKGRKIRETGNPLPKPEDLTFAIPSMEVNVDYEIGFDAILWAHSHASRDKELVDSLYSTHSLRDIDTIKAVQKRVQTKNVSELECFSWIISIFF